MAHENIDLEINEIYTAEQIRIFMANNKNSIFLSDTQSFDYDSDMNFKILSKSIKYVHKINEINRNHIVPTIKSKIFVIERI
ncbi:hypothetical protein [Bacillus halotolerans]|uniref:hypothetical protein n=1 Tax=Bacillus halotolerans TaxID=260554 RepID=UPI001C3CDF76|nr:hypothetical protein [Bacillus halotolerans]MBV5123299.1 hypothetical protein [Bacillus halotolerans]